MGFRRNKHPPCHPERLQRQCHASYVKRALRLELFAEASPEGLALEISKRLAAIAKATSRIHWRKRAAFARDLDLHFRMIQRLAESDPKAALTLLMDFLDLASSVFDFMTFAAVYSLYGFDEVMFHTGWFVESTLTGLMILLAIRTQRPFFLSRPGNLFLIAMVTIGITTVWIPFSPFAETLGFVVPSGKLLGIVFFITFLYLIGMEIVKRLFYRYLAT